MINTDQLSNYFKLLGVISRIHFLVMIFFYHLSHPKADHLYKFKPFS